MTSGKMLSESRGIAVKPRYVLMEPGTYPKKWKAKQQQA
jgi:H/ACA ribonucleoprotein complex subunit 4